MDNKKKFAIEWNESKYETLIIQKTKKIWKFGMIKFREKLEAYSALGVDDLNVLRDGGGGSGEKWEQW